MLKYKDFTLKARLYEMDVSEQKLLELGAKFEGEELS